MMVDRIGSVENKDIKTKKINKTFSMSADAIAFLDSVDHKSSFMNGLVEGYQKGQFIRPETAELLKKYKALFGVEGENALQKILSKRIYKIESNMESLKDSAPEEVKNRVGGAFLKLNRIYEELVAENERLDNKIAITFGLLFKRTGCNHHSIRGWIRANKERLEEYHQSIGISDPALHNRQMGVLKRTQKYRERSKAEEKERAHGTR